MSTPSARQIVFDWIMGDPPGSGWWGTQSEVDKVDVLLLALGIGGSMNIFIEKQIADLEAINAALRQQLAERDAKIAELEKRCTHLYDRTPLGIHDAI